MNTSAVNTSKITEASRQLADVAFDLSNIDLVGVTDDATPEQVRSRVDHVVRNLQAVNSNLESLIHNVTSV